MGPHSLGQLTLYNLAAESKNKRETQPGPIVMNLGTFWKPEQEMPFLSCWMWTKWHEVILQP